MSNNKRILLAFIPSAYNGNPASESGPKALEKYIYNNLLKDYPSFVFTHLRFDQNFDESVSDFFRRIQSNYIEWISSYSLIFLFGGNHLSIFPFFQKTLESGDVLSLDAHVDNYHSDTINHGTFLNYLNDTYGKYYIYGSRDNNKSKGNEIVLSSGNIPRKDISHLDIDLDVLDPSIFPYVGCPLTHGMTTIDLFRVLEEINYTRLNTVSISEYIPLLDKDNLGKRTILQIVRFIIHQTEGK